MKPGSIPDDGTFFKSCSIYKFKLMSSIYSTNIPKFESIGSSGLDVNVDVAPIVSEGSSVIRFRGRLGSTGLEIPFFFFKFRFWGGEKIATVEGFEPGTPLELKGVRDGGLGY